MRLLSLFAGLCALSALSGCAREPNTPHGDREVIAVADRNEPSVEITESAPPPVVAEPTTRPRLSHVVTLGAGTADAEYYGPDGAPRGQAQQQQTGVVVNNNVNVGGGYGYGGYYGGGYYGSGGYGSSGSRGSRTQSTESGYAPTGWEGAGRTAPQGQTPGVGGNFPAAPSFGPRPAR